MRMHLRMIDDRTGFSAINKVRTLGCGLLSWFKGFLSDERVKSAVPKTSFECDFAERQDRFFVLAPFQQKFFQFLCDDKQSHLRAVPVRHVQLSHLI